MPHHVVRDARHLSSGTPPSVQSSALTVRLSLASAVGKKDAQRSCRLGTAKFGTLNVLP